MNLMELAKEFGPYLGVIFFFLWRDAQREERYHKELSEKNTFIQTELMRLVERVNEALHDPKP